MPLGNDMRVKVVRCKLYKSLGVGLKGIVVNNNNKSPQPCFE